MYFDIQVNGYAGVDFHDPGLTNDDIHRCCVKLREGGVRHILATVTTEHLDRMCAVLRRFVAARRVDPLVAETIPGFHIEGPFINEQDGYRGAHPRDAVRPADVDAARQLLDAADGLVRIVTLAPERDGGFATTRFLADRNVIVAAGHCNPTLDELKGAIDAGLSMFTHLGNGCPMNMHRHDNIIQRALSLHERLWLCFIGDGTHVPIFALGNYLRAISLDRCIVVTDCVAPAGLGPGRYRIGRWDLVIGDDMVAMAPDRSHFVGSACTMKQVEVNLTGRLGLPAEAARRLIWDNPRRALHL